MKKRIVLIAIVGLLLLTLSFLAGAEMIHQTATVPDVCEENNGESIDHLWGDVEYRWNEDNTTVTATRVCQRHAEHIQTETVAVSSRRSKAPTCTEKGETTYTSAAFQNTAFQAQSKTLADIPATGHIPSAELATPTDLNPATPSDLPFATPTDLHPSDAVPATCTQSGLTGTVYCGICGEVIQPQEVIPALGHDLEHHAAKEPTCTEAGWEAYDTCRRCGYTTYQEIPAKGHVPWNLATPTDLNFATPTDWNPSDEVAPTCTQTGLTRTIYCGVCGAVIQPQEVIPALGHDLEHHDGKAATCTEIGWNEYLTCKRDGCGYTTYAEIPALGHDLEHHDAKAATCTEIGWNEYDTCRRDGCSYTTYTEIPALGHEIEQHDAQAPTCTEVGWNAYESCRRTGCDYTTYEEIPALGHDLAHHNGKAATCTEIGWAEYDACLRRDCGYTTYAEIPALGHDLVHHDAKAATCTEIGWAAYDTCRRDGCGYSTYAEIPALGHDWKSAEYVWSDNHGKVTATHVCKRDKTHTETETVGVIAVVVAPTEKTTGSAAFKSNAFKTEGFSVQTKEIVIPALRNLDVMRLPGSLRTIRSEAFMNLSCQAIILPDGCTTIGERAFAKCANLLYIRIPVSVKDYPENAFEGCNENLVIDWKK